LQKRIFFFVLLLICSTLICSCALFRKPLDNWSGFSRHLKETENQIRNERWDRAALSLKDATKAWRKVKPFLQVDIDHDYVKDIENDFMRLKGTVETKEKPNSLSYILLIQDNWRNIGVM
jgi:hypothetical protein